MFLREEDYTLFGDADSEILNQWLVLVPARRRVKVVAAAVGTSGDMTARDYV